MALTPRRVHIRIRSSRAGLLFRFRLPPYTESISRLCIATEASLRSTSWIHTNFPLHSGLALIRILSRFVLGLAVKVLGDYLCLVARLSEFPLGLLKDAFETVTYMSTGKDTYRVLFDTYPTPRCHQSPVTSASSRLTNARRGSGNLPSTPGNNLSYRVSVRLDSTDLTLQVGPEVWSEISVLTTAGVAQGRRPDGSHNQRAWQEP